jgi:uncharacterized protein with HEPN domain
MQHHDDVYLGSMRDFAEKVGELLAGHTRASFDSNKLLQFALTFSLRMIGGAAGRVSAQFKEQHVEIPWESIVGLPHRVMRDGLHVNPDVVWQVSTRDTPELAQMLGRLRARP